MNCIFKISDFIYFFFNQIPPQTHTNNEEKLNIKNVAYHSVKEAIASLTNLTNKKSAFYKQEKAEKPSNPVQEDSNSQGQTVVSNGSGQDQKGQEELNTSQETLMDTQETLQRPQVTLVSSQEAHDSRGSCENQQTQPVPAME